MDALNLHGDPWASALVGLQLEQSVPGKVFAVHLRFRFNQVSCILVMSRLSSKVV